MKEFMITKADMTAIDNMDDVYINDKGASLYKEDTYYKSVEYYRLGAAMGNVHSISNLGYCYLYGRDIEANTSLAIAYFVIASKKGDIDATYKLGDIYGSDKWGVKDKEVSNYYYLKAIKVLTDDNWNNVYHLTYEECLRDYPSLAFAVARELSEGGSLATDLDRSYILLRHAKLGYESAINNGATMYADAYQNVLKYLSKEVYDSVRDRYDKLFADDDRDLQGDED